MPGLSFQSCRDHRHLHSFPTRRSSDLVLGGAEDRDEIPFAIDSEGTVYTRKDRKSTRLNSSHTVISYAVFCSKKNSRAFGCRSCLGIEGLVDRQVAHGQFLLELGFPLA